MRTRDYVCSFAAPEAEAEKLVKMLQRKGIRAFHIPSGPERTFGDLVFVERIEVDHAADIWDKQTKEPDNGRLLRQRRRTVEILWGFERMVLPVGSWKNQD